MAMIIGLKIDVDTLRGTRLGVPPLRKLLAHKAVRASFFFSVGPDNMGRNLRRLKDPAFLRKMLRSKAPNLYGWDILLRGTLGPGPVIGRRTAPVIRSVAGDGHEIGLHAWDHYSWQNHLIKMTPQHVREDLQKGVDGLTDILGRPPVCSAAPAWKCNALSLTEKEKFPFRYNSDCRGDSVFRPRVHNRIFFQPQIPTTLPTYDEIIGQNGVFLSNYNEYLLGLLKPEGLNVLTVHAEVEGIARLDLFERFLEMVQSQGISLIPLGALLSEPFEIKEATVIHRDMPGREGGCACQSQEKP